MDGCSGRTFEMRTSVGLSGQLLTASRELSEQMYSFCPKGVSHVYDPVQYAVEGHRKYIEFYGGLRGRTLLLGMNPGPWGMAQTGVPFGDVRMVRDWMQIESTLVPQALPAQHPKYPILGFHCLRREGSGSRLWGWARERYVAADSFFRRYFVWNYCPLLFIANGRNVTPDALNRGEQQILAAACDAALIRVLEILKPKRIVGLGRYAERRARSVVGTSAKVDYLLHPSPANPAANRYWSTAADEALAEHR